VFATTLTRTITGEGSLTQGTYTGAPATFANLNSDDADVTYISIPSGEYHDWDFDSFVTSTNINSVTVYIKSKSGGDSWYQIYCRIGGTNYNVTNGKLTPGDYATYSGALTANPATGTAWTQATLNAATFGIYTPGGTDHRCTYMYIVVDYTLAAPSVTTTAATTITSTSAYLNGNVTNDGGTAIDERAFVWDTVSRANPGNVDHAATAYANNWAEAAVVIGTYTHQITPLTLDTTYYFRAGAHNVQGWTYGDELSFTTLGNPSITTTAATNINATAARLNALVNDDGGQASDVRFGYDVVTRATVAACANQTPWVNDTYLTGNTPYADITGLNVGTTYFFRVEIKNDVSTQQSSNELTFTTESGVYAPTNFQAIPNSTEVSLAWTKGSGSTKTKIQYKTGTFPTSSTDGTTAYNDTSSSYQLPSLTPGTTYYFRAYGVSGTLTSTTNITAFCTTLAAVATTSFTAPTTPSGWFSPPNYTVMNKLPIYGMVNWWGDTFGIPRATTWFLLMMFISVIIGVVTYRISNKLPIAMGMTELVIIMFAISGVISVWLTFPMALVTMIAWAVGERV